MNWFQQHRRTIKLLAVAIPFIAIAFLIPRITHADIGPADYIAQWIANLLFWLIQMLSRLLVVVINIMVAVAQYNNFLGATAVVKGWTIVRDISNMFFIVVQLIISFGTILRL